jgi:hypothetical protein
MDIARFSAGCGAVVRNAQLSQLSNGELDSVRAAFEQHGVLFFREQDFPPEEHRRFAHRWGEVVVNKFFRASEAHPEIAEVRKAVAGHGTEIANTIPTVLRAMPFIPLYPILGPRGQRWVPMHGILPFSRLREFHRRITQLHDDYAGKMDAHKVEKAAMFTSISTNGFLYEPVFYWEDDRTPFHKRYLPQEYLDTLPEYEANPEGRALVGELRGKIQEIFSDLGAVHMQVGKSYPYLLGRQDQATRILKDVKQSLDPDGLMNPGALGLE